MKSRATGGGKRGGEGHSLMPYKREPKASIFFLISYTKRWHAYTCNTGARRATYMSLIRFSPKTVEAQPMTQINATAFGVNVETPSLTCPVVPPCAQTPEEREVLCGVQHCLR